MRKRKKNLTEKYIKYKSAEEWVSAEVQKLLTFLRDKDVFRRLSAASWGHLIHSTSSPSFFPFTGVYCIESKFYNSE